MLREGKVGGFAFVDLLLVSLIDSQIYISVNFCIYYLSVHIAQSYSCGYVRCQIEFSIFFLKQGLIM